MQYYIIIINTTSERNVRSIYQSFMQNKRKIIAQICFYGALTFNVLLYCLVLCRLFGYDGGVNDVKTYYEIKNIAMAKDMFFNELAVSFFYGVLFGVPTVYARRFVRRIDFKAIFVQILPTLISIIILAIVLYIKEY